jgi:hypothetical protein
VIKGGTARHGVARRAIRSRAPFGGWLALIMRHEVEADRQDTPTMWAVGLQISNVLTRSIPFSIAGIIHWGKD